jgi:hypothetical protein
MGMPIHRSMERCHTRPMAIVPDDKNWTWVLERPCPECDFSADTIDVANMPTLIVDVAGRWPALFDAFSYR